MKGEYNRRRLPVAWPTSLNWFSRSRNAPERPYYPSFCGLCTSAISQTPCQRALIGVPPDKAFMRTATGEIGELWGGKTC
jgi:hypothetical protein